jgi:hypothetical protein
MFIVQSSYLQKSKKKLLCNPSCTPAGFHLESIRKSAFPSRFRVDSESSRSAAGELIIGVTSERRHYLLTRTQIIFYILQGDNRIHIMNWRSLLVAFGAAVTFDLVSSHRCTNPRSIKNGYAPSINATLYAFLSLQRNHIN